MRGGPPAEAAGAPPVSVRAFVLRFCLAFTLLEGFTLLVLWEARWFAPYANWNAGLTALCLRPFVSGVEAAGNVLSAPGFSIAVQPGCDAYQAIAVLLAGVLAFPAPVGRKWLGGVLGAVVLLVLNLARLAALLLTGIHAPQRFELMHLEVLPAAYVVASLGLLLGWTLWARR